MLPGLFADAAERARRSRLRRRRAALRARLHDGVVPVAPEHARRRLRRIARRTGCGCRSRSSTRCARGWARSAWSAAACSPTRRSRAASERRGRAFLRASSSRAPGSTSSRSRAAASSRTRSSRGSARSAYPYTGPSGFECMPTAIADERGPFGRNVPRRRRDPRRPARRGPRDAGRGRRRHQLVRPGRGDPRRAARPTSSAPRASRSPIPTGGEKIRLGRGAEVRRCTYTNYCEGLDQKHKQVTCQLWDREQLDEPGVAGSPGTASAAFSLPAGSGNLSRRPRNRAARRASNRAKELRDDPSPPRLRLDSRRRRPDRRRGRRPGYRPPSRPRRAGEARHGAFPRLLPRRSARRLRARRGAPALVRLRAGGDGLQRDRGSRSRLRDGPVGPRDEPLPPDLGRRSPPKSSPRGRDAARKAAAMPTRSDRERATGSPPSAPSTSSARRGRTPSASWPTRAAMAGLARALSRTTTRSRSSTPWRCSAIAYNSPPDKTYARQKQAAEILNRVLPLEPEHPGRRALHDPLLRLPGAGAAGARRGARLRQDRALGSPHALHMPSHIFTRLGLWPESIESNLASAATARRRWRAAIRARPSSTSSTRWTTSPTPTCRRAATPRPAQWSEAYRGSNDASTSPSFSAGVRARRGAGALRARAAGLEGGGGARAAARVVPVGEVPATPRPSFTSRAPSARRGPATRDRARRARPADRDPGGARRVQKGFDWATQVEIQRLAAAGWLARGGRKHDDAEAPAARRRPISRTAPTSTR